MSFFPAVRSSAPRIVRLGAPPGQPPPGGAGGVGQGGGAFQQQGVHEGLRQVAAQLPLGGVVFPAERPGRAACGAIALEPPQGPRLAALLVLGERHHEPAQQECPSASPRSRSSGRNRQTNPSADSWSRARPSAATARGSPAGTAPRAGGSNSYDGRSR